MLAKNLIITNDKSYQISYYNPDIIQPIDLQFMPKVMMIPIKMGGLSTHEEW